MKNRPNRKRPQAIFSLAPVTIYRLELLRDVYKSRSRAIDKAVEQAWKEMKKSRL